MPECYSRARGVGIPWMLSEKVDGFRGCELVHDGEEEELRVKRSHDILDGEGPIDGDPRSGEGPGGAVRLPMSLGVPIVVARNREDGNLSLFQGLQSPLKGTPPGFDHLQAEAVIRVSTGHITCKHDKIRTQAQSLLYGALQAGRSPCIRLDVDIGEDRDPGGMSGKWLELRGNNHPGAMSQNAGSHREKTLHD